MTTLNDILKKQKEFDSLHSSKFDWSKKITNDDVALLEHLLIAMMGEFGEAANHVKKVVRGDCTLDEIRNELSEEIIDIFIYVIKLIYQLDIDFDHVYEEKMKYNHKRFAKYERDKCE